VPQGLLAAAHNRPPWEFMSSAMGTRLRMRMRKDQLLGFLLKLEQGRRRIACGIEPVRRMPWIERNRAHQAQARLQRVHAQPGSVVCAPHVTAASARAITARSRGSVRTVIRFPSGGQAGVPWELARMR
jgi:hypothetical protein